MPGSLSWGIGVGIPGYEEYRSSSNYDPPARDDSYNITVPFEDGPRSPVATRDDSTGSVQSALQSRLAHLPPMTQSAPPHRPSAPVDPQTALAAQWSLDHVLALLKANSFSTEWQDTFRQLELHGSKFLDLGKQNAGKGPSLMYSTINPKLCEVTKARNINFDQTQAREEGKRLRKLVRGINHNGGVPASSPFMRQRGSTIDHSSSTPSTAGDADSPGKQMPPSVSPRVNSLSQPQAPKAAAFPPPETGAPQMERSRSAFTESTLRGLDVPTKRQSPSSSITEMSSVPSPTSTETHTNSSRTTIESSPQLSSVKPSSIAGRYYNSSNSAHQRGTSSEQSLNIAQNSIPGGAASKGQDKRRPSVADTHGRNGSADATHPGKEHRNIMSKIMNRKRKDEPATTFEDMGIPNSPSSPNAMRNLFSGSNASDTSLTRPRSGHDRGSLYGRLQSKSELPKKYIMVTNDGHNYRLLDVSKTEGAEDFRGLVRYYLQLPAETTDVPIFMTSPGQTKFTSSLSDAQVIECLHGADAEATLKLYAKTPLKSGPQSGPNSASRFSVPSPLAIAFGPRTADEETLKALAPAPLTASKKDVDDKEKPYQSLRGLPSASREEREKELRKRIEDEREVELKKRGGENHGPDLKQRMEEYRKNVEQKQRDYHDKRRSRLTPGGRHEVIDFDKRRDSLNDEKRDSLVPLRQPPPAPSDSHTLLKANSLRKSNPSSIRRTASERSDGSSSHRSWDLAESNDDKKLHSPYSGIAGALASAGSMSAGFGAPKTTSDRSRPNSRPSSSRAGESSTTGSGRPSPKGSPRSPGFTMSKGNVPFRIPDYDVQNRVSMSPDEAAAAMVCYKDDNDVTDAVRASIYSTSPHASPPRAQKRPVSLYRQSTTSSRKSYGPNLDFKEHPVSFLSRSATSADGSDEDSDSDGGLFAMPLGGTKTTKLPAEGDSDSQSSPSGQRQARPSLSLRTGSQRRNKTVSFSGESRGTDDDVTPRGENPPTPRQPSTVQESTPFSAAYTPESPDETSKDFRRRSFYSDVWADRPAVETVAQRLDEFFPNVDLDQPMLDPEESTPPASPNTLRKQVQKKSHEAMRTTYLSSTDDSDEGPESSDTNPKRQRNQDKHPPPSIAQRNLRRASGISRTRSIRDVVKSVYIPSHEPLPPLPPPKNDAPKPTSHPHPPPHLPPERKEEVHDLPTLANRLSTLRKSENMMRRRSTKMFGARIEQIRPQRGSGILNGLETIPQETPVPPQDHVSTIPPTNTATAPAASSIKRTATFKWLKGQLIGKGTFGKVYLGFNTTTAELMAVKQVEVDARRAGSDKDKIKAMVKALDQEIDTMQNLEHENIVAYLGCEREELKISIFLEYIDGGSIGSCLRKHGKFEEPVVSSLTRQTLQGLAYLHDSGILHRDLKADNILLTSDGICKISDFGISKKTDNIYGDDAQNTMQGSVFWMAPEVVRSQGAGYSAKVDIWSLGCVVLEMFAGRRPWAKDEAIGAIYKLGTLNQPPPIPDDVSKAINPAAIGFMLDCFTIDPRDRPQAVRLLEHEFCRGWQNFSFFDSELYQKIKPRD